MITTGPAIVRFPITGLVFSLFFCCVSLFPVDLATARPNPVDGRTGSETADGGLDRVRILIQANVLELARSILETEGPPVRPTWAWLNWERQLWALYRTTGRWEQLLKRTRQIPASFPDRILYQSDIEAVRAQIELGQGAQARVLLRKRLLSTDTGHRDNRKLRKLLIESYLVDDYLNEAHIAMRHYQSDFRSREQDWLLLSAGIHLQLNDPDSAVNILAPLDQPAARLLRIYARLQNETMTPVQAVEKINRLDKDMDASGQAPLPLWQTLSVRAYAGLLSDTPQSALVHLEQYLVVAGQSMVRIDRAYPSFGVVDLLNAYRRVALNETNRLGLLLGESTDLMIHALQLPQEAHSVRKAILGYLLQGKIGPPMKRQLNNLFLTALMESNQSGVIPYLYGEDKLFGKLDLSGDVGLELSNRALEMGNIELTAQINNSISVIPRSMERLQWLLHVARISIIAGHYERGARELMEWVHAHDHLTAEQADQVLQPVFDLQKVDQHTLALELLDEINNRVVSRKHIREIAYWKAESFQAMRQFVRAADSYLFSAMQKNNGWDQWGIAARYRAAESLQSANLVTDARVLYEDLLVRATDDKSRAPLKQKLQQLWLLESRPDVVEAAQ